MTENEKNLQELDEWFKLNPTEVAAYAFQKKQLEDEMARESGQAQAATGGTAPPPSPIQQEAMQAPPVQQTAAPVTQTPSPSPVIPKIHVRVEGREIGAFEREEVIKKIRAGEIRKDARVLRDGMDDWVNAGNLPELETYFDEMKGFYAAEENRRREAEQAAAKAAEAEKLYKEGLECQRCQNWDNGRELLIKAAEMGNVLAQKHIAKNYLHGDQHFPRSGEKSVYWWEKAAEQGDPEGCFHTGQQYRARYELSKMLGKEYPDYNKGEEFLNKAEALLNKAIEDVNNDAVINASMKGYWLDLAIEELKKILKLKGKGGGLFGLFGKKK